MTDLIHSEVGTRYGDFEIVKAITIQELQCQLIELVHKPTGAQVLHLANDDPENLFSLAFQTLPSTSNGVAHILEHTVLCGSAKFPMRDPFFAMTRRSLNTFMNAMTGSDFTCYPAASQIPKDFYNLLEVYLDAVFHPLLTELSFLQEGCRPALSQTDDIESPLEYKGIVINEMKGVMASADARLSEAIGKALFPNTVYGVNSGGDPAVIPELTYEELKQFHATYYHPSRCLFFFYGNLPLEKHLDFITEHALKEVSPQPPLPVVARQPRFKQPQKIELRYPASPERQTEEHALIALGWLTCDQMQQQELLGLSLIDSVLMDTDASLLKRVLLKSGLCKQAAFTLDTELAEIPAVLTFKGCKAENADALEQLVLKTLKEIADQGLPKELVENALHQMEFYRTEITGDSAPYGLSLFMRSALARFHGALPEDSLKIHSLFDRLRQTLKEQPDYLSQLIRRYLIDNSHRVKLILRPDIELAKEELDLEKQSLLDIAQKLGEEGLVVLQKQARALDEFQNDSEEEAKEQALPTLTREDVPKESRKYALQEEACGDLKVFQHETFTNGIVYAALVYPLPQLNEDELSLVRLFTLLVPQLGFGGKNYVQSLETLQAYTGGVSLSLGLHPQAQNPKNYNPSLTLSGKALYRNSDKLFTIYKEIISQVDFGDKDRLREVILKHYTSLESQLERGALRYATHLSSLGIDLASQISNHWFGWSYFQWLRQLRQALDQRLDDLIVHFKRLHEQLLGVSGAHLVLTADQKMLNQLRTNRFYGLSELPKHPFNPWTINYPLVTAKREGYCISSPVAFISRVCQAPSYTHPDAPAITAATQLFDRLTLHPLIREQGGAYGGGSSASPLSGHLQFFSYRDPNILSTLGAFHQAVAKVIDGDFGAQELEEAILEVIQDCDSPVAPGSRGILAYSWQREGRTQEVRQAFRDRLLGLTPEAVSQAVARHLPSAFDLSTPVVFAGRELLERENLNLKERGSAPFELVSI